jgi:UDP-N-acetylmuramoyl-L-alanyl-D-glutamate--2,6-diaminopimelate ligase
MRLAELAKHLDATELRGSGETEIRGVALDSRQVERGDLFAALCGTGADGTAFVPDALARGAVAVLAGTPLPGLSVPVLVAEEPRRALAQAASLLCGRPSERLAVVGITGTNGKTTTAWLVRHLLNHAGRRCGLAGTVCYDDGAEEAPAPLTTPDCVTLNRLLAAMAAHGCRAAAVEASSHALDQGRVAGLRWAAGVFTNLTRDHLDYHGDMEAYAATKARLFAALPATAPAILNADDAWSERFAEAAGGPVRTYALEADAEVRAEVRAMDLGGTSFDLLAGGERIACRSLLVGRHNLYNILAAAAACTALGVEPAAVGEALRTFPGVPGRLERFGGDGEPTVFVDYAHTEDALRRVLAVLRPLCRGRLAVVFGCGGDRDRGKRPAMGRAAEELADRVVLTSDNPRGEAPAAILAEIRAGLLQPRAVLEEPDRARAVQRAVAEAAPEDTVLVAGKGHEDYQIIGARRLHLDDRELVRAALRGTTADSTPGA